MLWTRATQNTARRVSHRTPAPHGSAAVSSQLPSGHAVRSVLGARWPCWQLCWRPVDCYASALSAFQSLSDCVFMLYNRNIVACACLISSLLKLPGFEVVAPCSCTPYGSPHTVHTTLTHDLEHRGSQRRDTPTAVSDSDRARP